MQVGLTNKESPRDAWEVIHKIRIGVDREKEANAERLRQEFTEIKFKPNEGVEDFSLCITALENEPRVHGDEVMDKKVIKKMHHSIPEKLEQLAILSRRSWSSWLFQWDTPRSKLVVDRGGGWPSAGGGAEEEGSFLPSGGRQQTLATDGGGMDNLNEGEGEE
jgi:hypothetical protein